MVSSASSAWHSAPIRAAVIAGAALAAAAAGVWTAGFPGEAVPSTRLKQHSFAATPLGSMPAGAPTLVLRGRYAGGRISGLAGMGLVYAINGGGVTHLAPEPTDGGFVARATAELLRRPCLIHVQPIGVADLKPFDPILVFHDSSTGDFDLGELPPGGEGPVVIEGRVVDESDRGVAGANVSVSVRIGTWTLNMADAATTTDAAGRFVWRAHVRGVNQFVVTLKRGWSAVRPVDARPGARDVVLRGRRSFARSGSVELPQGMPLDGLLIQVCGAGVGHDSEATVDARSVTRRTGVLEFPAQASFKLEGIPDGVYDVFLRRRGSSMPVAEQKGWESKSGDVPPLCAETMLRSVTLIVYGPDGAPARDARVWIRESGRLDRFGSASRTDADGRFLLAMSDVAGRVAAHAPGCTYEFTEIAGEVVTLQLREARTTDVILRVPGGGKRAAPDDVHGVSLHWVAEADQPRPRGGDRDSDDPRAEEDLHSDFSAAGVAQIPVVAPGWYSVRAVVRRKDGSWRASYAPGQACYVRADGSGTAVDVQLPSSWNRAFEPGVAPTPPPR